MSNLIEDAVEKAEAQLPDSSEVSSTGATIHVRDVSRYDAESLDGKEVGRKEFRLVEHFSSEDKFVFQLVTGVKHKVVA